MLHKKKQQKMDPDALKKYKKNKNKSDMASVKKKKSATSNETTVGETGGDTTGEFDVPNSKKTNPSAEPGGYKKQKKTAQVSSNIYKSNKSSFLFSKSLRNESKLNKEKRKIL